MAESAPGIRGYLFDLDGTLYEGGRAVDGAAEKLQQLTERKIPHCFVTNTTSKPRTEIVDLMRAVGLPGEAERIFTAPAVAREWLMDKKFTRCHFLLKPSLMEDLTGIESVNDRPQAVVVGDMGDEFSYEKLNRAFRFLIEDQNCAFITLAKNRFYKGKDGLMMDVGAFVAALEFATGRTAENIGKPAAAFFRIACESLGLKPGEIAMVGDDLESDVLGAQACGLKGILVQTGKFRPEQLGRTSETPDLVISSVATLSI